MEHIPVLLQETIREIGNITGEVVLDATLGRGGHFRALAELIGPQGRLIGLDVDPENIEFAKTYSPELSCKTDFVCSNFRNLDKALNALGIQTENLSAILFDLGTNALQIGPSRRGFSFQHNEPLVMTLSGARERDGLTAADVVNSWSEESIEAILRGFGGEQFSGRIAKNIVEARRGHRIETTADLVEIIEAAVPEFYKHKRIHCATKTFQAIRVAVNDEFGALREALPKAWGYLKRGGRIAVISFHEGEDRIVKNLFKRFHGLGGILKNKKPIIPSRAEIKNNPRSRSAKLRVIEKI